MKLEVKVVEWNDYYKAWGSRERLKDLGTKDYVEGVAYSLLDVCGGDIALAIAVFEHPLNNGGWMVGDAIGFLRKLSYGVSVSPPSDTDEDGNEDGK